MKKFYITTSIAYTNAFPHIGFALESIQADVLARYHRLLAEDVFFLTGTDEHGAKISKAAKEAGKSPEDFVDEISGKFKELGRILNLSNNDFIRTTDKIRHWPAVREVWQKLKEKGDIYKKNYQGLYCVGCEAFKTKRELINGKCSIHKTEPEKIEEENYFFRLSKYSKKIEKAIKTGKLEIIPKTRRNEILGLIKQGLEDVSFSRPSKDLQWGISVPDDPTQKIYVWADALTNYISALGYPRGENFKKYWPADVHCIGKDILKFHSLIWPGMLWSLGLSLPKSIFVHGFITVSGQKMSKSLGNVIDPFELVKKYGLDPVRYYLLREIPSAEDGDFTFDKFEKRYNSDLASGLGNLTARVLTMVEKYCQGKVPEIKINPEKHPLASDKKIYNWKKSWRDLGKHLDNFQFNEALASVWKFIAEADKYIEQNKPWVLAKEGKAEELNWVLYGLLDSLNQICRQIYIFMPDSALKIADSLGIKEIFIKKSYYKDNRASIKPGVKTKKNGLLFPRI